MKLVIERLSVTAKTRKLKANWTLDIGIQAGIIASTSHLPKYDLDKKHDDKKDHDD